MSYFFCKFFWYIVAFRDFGEHLDTVASLNSDGSIVNLILSLGFKVQDYMVNTYVEARNRDVAHRAINHMRHGNLPNNSVQSHRRNQVCYLLILSLSNIVFFIGS